MARSNFSRSHKTPAAGAEPHLDETYDLKGLNLVAPDQVIPEGETPHAQNNRRFADNDAETAIAQRTREGSTHLSTPVGETLSVQNANTITGDLLLTVDTQIAIPFIAGDTGVLTKYETRIKKALNTRGYVIIEIFTDNSGLPNTLVAQSSIAPSAVTTSYQDLLAYFIDAPDMVDGDTYHAVFSMQELGVGSYSLAKVAAGTYHTSADAGATWTAATGAARYKAYVSTAGFVKGFSRRSPSSGPTDYRTLIALGTNVYQIPDSPAVPASIDSTVDSDSTFVRFREIDDLTLFVDGESHAKSWDGTTVTLFDEADAPDAPIHILPYKERILMIPKATPNLVKYSDIYEAGYHTWFPENFFYVGRIKNADPVTAWEEFQENVTIFTSETKYTLTGTNVTSFDANPHVGTKGAVSQEAIARGNEVIYFLSNDRTINAWNGVSDKEISFKVSPELKKILDLDKVRLHFYNNQLRVYYNKNPDTNVTHMLLYDTLQDQWFHDTGRPVLGSLEWSFNNNELIEISSRCGALYYGERGYSDLGKAIDFEYWTAYKLYSSGLRSKRIKRFRPIVRPADSAYYLKVGKDVDFKNQPNTRDWLVDSGGAKWGTFNWGDGTVYGSTNLVDNKATMSGRGKHIQYRFAHNGIDQPVGLYGYGAIVKIGRAR